jgi:putative cofactor-binding repeat protein
MTVPRRYTPSRAAPPDFASLVRFVHLELDKIAQALMFEFPAGGGGGATDLGYTAATRLLTSSTGADVTLPLATATLAGLSSPTGDVVDVVREGADPTGVATSHGAFATALAALTAGDVFKIPPGRYRLGASGWTGLSVSGLARITVIADGAEIFWDAQPSQTTGFDSSKVGWKFTNCDDLVIRGLSVDGNGINTIGLFLDQCERYRTLAVTAYAHAGLTQLMSVRGRFGLWAHCISRDSQGTARGFWIGNSAGYTEDDVTVADCTAHNNNATGIVLHGNRNKAVGNRSSDNDGSGIICSSSGDPNDSEGTSITGNVLVDNLFYAYQTDNAGGGTSERVAITGNYIRVDRTGASGGIYLNAAIDHVVSGNVISGSTADIDLIRTENAGGPVRNLAITGNVIRMETNNLGGIVLFGNLDSAAAPHEDITIVGNTIIGAAINDSDNRGIWVETILGSQVMRRVVIANNTVQGTGVGIEVGAVASGAAMDNITVSGNTVSGAATKSFRFRSSTVGQITNLILLGNQSSGVNGLDLDADVVPKYNAGNSWNTSDGSGIKSASLVVPYGVTRAKVTVSDAAVTPASRILVQPAGPLDTDENDPEMDAVTFAATAGTGAFDVTVMSAAQRIGGTFRLNYLVS